ncbi:MAG TPA: TldD/PmbA family protein [Thermoanaerobaculia bacterium]|nr:TldD/PmbA family protein [Thermoanaerobaculia bacterium]
MGELGAAESVVERALAAAAGDEADAACMVFDRNLTRFAESRIHQNIGERSASLAVRVVREGRIGVATTSAADDESIASAVRLAADLASRSEPVPGFRGLHRSAPRGPDLPAWDAETAAATPLEKAEALRAIFETGRARAIRFAGAFSTGRAALAVGNTWGVRQSAAFTSAEASMIALSGAASGFATALARRRSAIDLPLLADEAAGRATLLRDAEQSLDPGEYTVILEPPALVEIFEWMNTITFSGRAWEDGSSFFVGNLGCRILSPSFTLADDALDPDFLPFPFDLEGLPKRRVALIDRGVIGGPLVDKVASDRLGIEPTASAASLPGEERGIGLHLSMAGGEHSVEELIASTGRGVWVTRFHYLNGLLDPKSALMTGMTRDGTFLIRDGEVVARLPNLRWTQSMVEALGAIEGLTRKRRTVGTFWNPLGGTIAPTARIGRWRFTGASGG